MDKMNLPEEWLLTKLDSLAVDISYGYTASSTSENVGPQMLRITDIQNNQVNWQDVPFCQIKEDKKAKYKLEKGDLLFARTGATVGKSFLLKEEPPESVYASYLIRVRTAHSELTSNLSHFFNSAQYWQQITEFSSGIGQPNVNGTKLKGLDIPLPPLAEQKVIAEKLDKLLAKVDGIKSRLEAVPDTLKRFRQSILAAAVSGKLTEEWRVSAKLDWKLSTIGEVATVATGKTPKRTEPKYWEGGDVPWLTSSVTGLEFCYEAEQFVTQEAVDECKLKLFPVGTLLLAMYGEGKTRGQVTELKIEGTCNQACAAILIDESKVSKEYVKLRLLENYEETRKAAVGGNQPNLNLNKVREIGISLPTRDEQTEIVRRVEKLFAYADKVESEVNAAQERVNKLTQSILAKAFRGELTAKWREQNPELISGDNSAEALLEKIKAEREKLTPKKKTRARTKA